MIATFLGIIAASLVTIAVSIMVNSRLELVELRALRTNIEQVIATWEARDTEWLRNFIVEVMKREHSRR